MTDPLTATGEPGRRLPQPTFFDPAFERLPAAAAFDPDRPGPVLVLFDPRADRAWVADAAIALAKNQLVIGLGAQRPFDQGVAEARLGAGSLLGKKEPAYVALSALPVQHTNVLNAWKQVYHANPPKDLSESFAK